MIILLVLFAVVIFFMFRRSRAQQKAQQEQQAKMLPGVEVMTSFGLFGTVQSIDAEDNKVVLEISPGTTATVHRQAVTKIITPAEAVEETPVVPDDASSLTGPVQAAAEPGEAKDVSSTETAEETLARLNKENNKEQ
ncbi:MAG: preprotein translocase subunit YajC [Renibacterium salmoninarum]|nr:preprotein translocase subunit YajC [Renibacterium salmoninarum]